MSVRLSLAITCVPERRPRILRLVQRLNAGLSQPTQFLELKTLWDMQHQGLWWNTERAWRAIHPEATHHMVMCDDVEVCADFIETIMLATSFRPDNPLMFYTTIGMNRAAQRALDQGGHWFVSPKEAWGVGLLLPRKKVFEFLLWQQQHIDPNCPHDDTRSSLWMAKRNHPAWVTVPALMQHALPTQSTVGHNNPNRYSKQFIGRDQRGMGIDWSLGLDNPPSHSGRLSQNDWKWYR